MERKLYLCFSLDVCFILLIPYIHRSMLMSHNTGIAVGCGAVLVVIIFLIARNRRKNPKDDFAFDLSAKPVAAAGTVFTNPMDLRQKRDVAYDNPIYDSFDIVV